jgi:hypothetical protein
VDVVQGQGGGGSSWEMILVQGFLVTLLVLISVAWACCCKKYVHTHTLIKKIIKFSLIYRENSEGVGCKVIYVTNSLLIYG